MTAKLRIALYTHSTNPRGGVVHSLELGDALAQAGHDVTIHAPDPSGRGFFRATGAKQISIPAAPPAKSTAALVAQRIAEVAAYIRQSGAQYDIHHAQDPINANALADCIDSGHVRNFIRTVHHGDSFADRELQAWQLRGIHAAAKCFCVSKIWRDYLQRVHHIEAELVPNGVSLHRYNATPTANDDLFRNSLNLTGGKIFLAIGGIEERKNTINILRAFALCLEHHPDAKLIIAGGVSLLDHSKYQAEFDAELSRLDIRSKITILGAVHDENMPALYRLADVLVFPSTKEGFGLVVLEALASEIPVVVSRIPPFTEYLTAQTCNFCAPYNPVSIADAMCRALTLQARAAARVARTMVAGTMGWNLSAARHLSLYKDLMPQEPANA